MKKQLLFTFIGATLTAGLNAQVITVEEDFEGHAPGSPVVQTLGAPWATWSGGAGTDEDVLITDEQANSGENSLLFTSASPSTGGPGDILLNLGEQTEGVYGLTWMMYVPAGSGAYFNIQHSETPGESFGIEVIFRANNTIEFIANNETTTTATFPNDEWFAVNIVVNLALSQGTFQVNDDEPLAWPFNTTSSGDPGINQLGAINFFTYAGGDPVHFYIDDVVVADLTTVGIEENDNDAIMLYPNPVRDVLTVGAPSLEGTSLVSLIDLTGRTVVENTAVFQQGGVARTTIDMAGLPEGVYLVRIQNGAADIVQRVVKN